MDERTGGKPTPAVSPGEAMYGISEGGREAKRVGEIASPPRGEDWEAEGQTVPLVRTNIERKRIHVKCRHGFGYPGLQLE